MRNGHQVEVKSDSTQQAETIGIKAPGVHRRMTALNALTIFSSAFLLFEVEPLIAKIILPQFGGAATVWLVCLLFFQLVLLLGYLYAHWLTTHLRSVVQRRTHAFLLLASLAALPITPHFWAKAWFGTITEARVLLVLGSAVGLPYFLLSTTTPLLQAWYAQASYAQAGNSLRIYRFYALSNAGSLIALLTYPTLIEPFASSSHQATGWSFAYAAFVAICVFVALSDRESKVMPQRTRDARPDWQTLGLWAALAACGSALLLAITNHISQNIAPVPLLWIIPLTLYLLTFILCFEGRNWYRRSLFLRLFAVAVGSMTYALSSQFPNLPISVLIPLFGSGLFVCCMVCHGELARLKPRAEHLTYFYVMCSLGAVLGSLFVALLAPHIFSGSYEPPITLGFCTLLLLLILHKDPESPFHKRGRSTSWLLVICLAAAIIAGLTFDTLSQSAGTRTMVRNFYGLLRVIDQQLQSQEKDDHNSLGRRIIPYRRLVNGTITHGLQFLDPGLRDEPTTYYSRTSGVGLAFQVAAKVGALQVGAIGLGAGTIAAYGRAGDRFTFYEINPLVEQVARKDFTFLSDCAAQVSVVIGDARLSLQKDQATNFDLLVVDAFSGDAIPVHLLTREAFALYSRHLKPGGLLLVHISNSHLDLQPVVVAGASSQKKHALLIDNGPDKGHGVFRATWIIVGSGALFDELQPRGRPLDPHLARAWTDDYSSLLPILK
jgi:hypothetical protein